MEYSFHYGNSDIDGYISADLTEQEEQLILQAIRKHFDKLEDVYDLKPIRDRLFRKIERIEPVTEDDILWIYFPTVLVERVLFGK